MINLHVRESHDQKHTGYEANLWFPAFSSTRR